MKSCVALLCLLSPKLLLFETDTSLHTKVCDPEPSTTCFTNKDARSLSLFARRRARAVLHPSPDRTRPQSVPNSINQHRIPETRHFHSPPSHSGASLRLRPSPPSLCSPPFDSRCSLLHRSSFLLQLVDCTRVFGFVDFRRRRAQHSKPTRLRPASRRRCFILETLPTNGAWRQSRQQRPAKLLAASSCLGGEVMPPGGTRARSLLRSST
jgi:hypothetical protein